MADTSRPKPAGQDAPKQPDGEPSPFLFRFYEAAVRVLTDPASKRRSEVIVAGPTNVGTYREGDPEPTAAKVRDLSIGNDLAPFLRQRASGPRKFERRWRQSQFVETGTLTTGSIAESSACVARIRSKISAWFGARMLTTNAYRMGRDQGVAPASARAL